MWKCEEEGMMCKTGRRLWEGWDYGWDEVGEQDWEELGGGRGRSWGRGPRIVRGPQGCCGGGTCRWWRTGSEGRSLCASACRSAAGRPRRLAASGPASSC